MNRHTLDRQASVQGMRGRVRLAATSGNVDRSRKNIQAYEYLCHVGEAKLWIEKFLDMELPPITQLEESLRNGVILASLAQKFAPSLVPRIFKAEKLQFRHSDNINYFFDFLQYLNLPELFRFEMIDLYEKKNPPKVIFCIHAVSYLLERSGVTDSAVQNLIGRLSFTDDELSKTQKGLDSSNQPLPNFSTLQETFYVEPEPEVDEEAIIHIQALARGCILRSEIARQLQALWSEEHHIVHFQARCRGALLRSEFEEIRRVAREEAKWATNLQALSRGYLVRCYVQEQKNLEVFELLQAQIRGYLLRQNLHQDKEDLLDHTSNIISMQAYIRGFTVRRKLNSLKRSLQGHKTKITKFQAACRGFLSRSKYLQYLKLLQSHNPLQLQAICRGYIFRTRLRRTIHDPLKHEMAKIISFQALIRGIFIREEYNYLLNQCRIARPLFIAVQALCRGYTIRKKHSDKAKHFRENMSQIVKIQNMVRAKQQSNAYKSLTVGKDPPVSTIKNFAHLLNDTNLDFKEEIEREQLKKIVVHKVKANETAERYIDEIDIKIALLVKNKITLDDVIKHQKSFSAGRHKLTHMTSSDSLSLKALNKNSRRRLELYQGLLFLLQTEPDYLARLFYHSRSSGIAESEVKKTESLVMTLFVYGQQHREEYLLLQLIAKSVIIEVRNAKDMQDLVRGNFMWMRIVVQYCRNAQERKFLREMFRQSIQAVVDDKTLDFEIDPLTIYKSLMLNEELQTGQRSSRQHISSSRQALHDRQTRSVFGERVENLMRSTEIFISGMENRAPRMPYGMRYISKILFEALRDKFTTETEDNILKVVSNLIFARYFNPAIISPESCNVLDSNLNGIQRKNLSEVSKNLSQICSSKPYAEDHVLSPFNSHIERWTERIVHLFYRIIDVPLAAEHFGIDEYDDLKRTQKPTLYISSSDIIAIHSLVFNEITVMAPNQDDLLRSTMKELGPLSKSGTDELMSLSSGVMTLTLDTHFNNKKDDASAEDNALFAETKRFILYIIKIQNGSTLLEILVQRVTQDDEDQWQEIIKEELEKSDKPGSKEMYSDLSKMSFADLKRCALENILALESFGKIKRSNNFQDLLNAIAVDIRTKHRQKLQRHSEMDKARSTIATLEEKSSYLDEQLEAYSKYIEGIMETLQTKKKKGKPLIPFTNQYFHIRNLQRQGRVPKFGSYRYTASKLMEKGILESMKDFDPKLLNQIQYTISCDVVGVFYIEATHQSVQLPGGSTHIRLDDLLAHQFNNHDLIPIFDGMARMKVEMLLQFLFRKYYQ